MEQIPTELNDLALELNDQGKTLIYTFDAQAQSTGVAELLNRLAAAKVGFHDLKSSESTLEDIFVNIVRNQR